MFVTDPNQYPRGGQHDAVPECKTLSVELLAIDNLTRCQQVQTGIIEATRELLDNHWPETSTARQRVDHWLGEVDWLVHSRGHAGHQPVTVTEAARLDYQKLRRHDINDAIELFGRQVNPFNSVFVGYVDNYSLYHPDVDPGLGVNEALDRIFVHDLRKEHAHVRDQQGNNFRCRACDVARLKTFMDPSADPQQREHQFQLLREQWLETAAS